MSSIVEGSLNQQQISRAPGQRFLALKLADLQALDREEAVFERMVRKAWAVEGMRLVRGNNNGSPDGNYDANN